MCVNECVCVSVVFHWQATIMGPVGCFLLSLMIFLIGYIDVMLTFGTRRW